MTLAITLLDHSDESTPCHRSKITILIPHFLCNLLLFALSYVTYSNYPKL